MRDLEKKETKMSWSAAAAVSSQTETRDIYESFDKLNLNPRRSKTVTEQGRQGSKRYLR
jgi:hypothetical protein